MNMLVKVIAPIIVVLASLGSLFFISRLADTKKTQAQTIVDTKASLDRTEKKLEATENTVKQKTAEILAKDGQIAKAESDLTTAKKEAKDAQDLAQQRMKEVEAAQTQFADKTKEAEETKTKLATAEQEVTTLRTQAQETAKKIEELAKLDELKKQVGALGEENKELGRQLGDLRGQNTKLAGELEDLRVTPVNVRGQVSAIQDRWGFVVLNIGEQQKVRADTQFMVYRDTKLVCKVQVVSVGQNTSIAEVMPDFQRGYPRVGDNVLR